MARYRNALPQLDPKLFLTDGGMETTLIFREGLELPYFASFHLLHRLGGEAHFHQYFSPYVSLAKRFGTGLILDSPTWRANPDWAEKLHYTPEALAQTNRKAIRLLEDIRVMHETPETPMVISGCIGPRGDGYVPGTLMNTMEAATYHEEQIRVFADTAADMVCAATLNYVEEAIGITQAAQDAAMPVAISFTVETDGRLPSGHSLEDAIARVDKETRHYPAYYMINCAHPAHFQNVLAEGGTWTSRIHGIRANASRMSHAELDEAEELDSGNPRELGLEYADLLQCLPNLNIMGGCCGTDHRHIEQIADACSGLFPATV